MSCSSSWKQFILPPWCGMEEEGRRGFAPLVLSGKWVMSGTPSLVDRLEPLQRGPPNLIWLNLPVVVACVRDGGSCISEMACCEGEIDCCPKLSGLRKRRREKKHELWGQVFFPRIRVCTLAGLRLSSVASIIYRVKSGESGLRKQIVTVTLGRVI